MEEEIWKEVVGYEGIYEVSSKGRVKSVGHGSGRRSGRILKPSLNTHGYKFVVLCVDRKSVSTPIHKIVAMSFLNHIPNGRIIVINHINGDRTNNDINNLEVVKYRENVSTCYRKNFNNYSSKYVGVSWDKVNKKWIASIYINGFSKTIGRYIIEEEASAAYQNELLKIN